MGPVAKDDRSERSSLKSSHASSPVHKRKDSDEKRKKEREDRDSFARDKITQVQYSRSKIKDVHIMFKDDRRLSPASLHLRGSNEERRASNKSNEDPRASSGSLESRGARNPSIRFIEEPRPTNDLARNNIKSNEEPRLSNEAARGGLRFNSDIPQRSKSNEPSTSKPVRSGTDKANPEKAKERQKRENERIKLKSELSNYYQERSQEDDI